MENTFKKVYVWWNTPLGLYQYGAKKLHHWLSCSKYQNMAYVWSVLLGHLIKLFESSIILLFLKSVILLFAAIINALKSRPDGKTFKRIITTGWQLKRVWSEINFLTISYMTKYPFLLFQKCQNIHFCSFKNAKKKSIFA